MFCRERGQSLFREISTMVTIYVTDRLRWFCGSLSKVTENRKGILTSPLRLGTVTKTILLIVAMEVFRGQECALFKKSLQLLG